MANEHINDDTESYEIANGAQLPRFIGKNVAIIGFVTDFSKNRMGFNIRSTDGVIIQINLNESIDNTLEGYVEVRGVVENKTTIKGKNLVCFNNEKFDEKAHNALCKLFYSVPELFSMNDKSNENASTSFF